MKCKNNSSLALRPLEIANSFLERKEFKNNLFIKHIDEE